MSEAFTVENIKAIRAELEKFSIPPIIGKDGRAFYKIEVHESWLPVIAQEAVEIKEDDDLIAAFPNAKYKWRDLLICGGSERNGEA